MSFEMATIAPLVCPGSQSSHAEARDTIASCGGCGRRPGGAEPARRSFRDTFVVEATLQDAIYGRVVRARHRQTGVVRAVKVIDRKLAAAHTSRSGNTVVESAGTELRLLRQLRDRCPHPGLLCLTPEDEQFVEPAQRFVTLPFAERGDLFAHVEASGGGLEDAECRSLFAQIFLAVHHLHTAAAHAHNDLSLENVLLTRDGRALVCDYGLARPLGVPWQDVWRVSGKIPYQAPEIFSGVQQRCDAKADVFSLGVMLFVARLGTPPFERPDRQDKRFAYVQEGRLRELLEMWGVASVLPPSLVELLGAMLREDPALRPSLADVIAHPWVCEAVAEARHAVAATAAALALPPLATAADPAARCHDDGACPMDLADGDDEHAAAEAALLADRTVSAVHGAIEAARRAIRHGWWSSESGVVAVDAATGSDKLLGSSTCRRQLVHATASLSHMGGQLVST